MLLQYPYYKSRLFFSPKSETLPNPFSLRIREEEILSKAILLGLSKAGLQQVMCLKTKAKTQAKSK